jgi:hypothetical protein
MGALFSSNHLLNQIIAVLLDFTILNWCINKIVKLEGLPSSELEKTQQCGIDEA